MNDKERPVLSDSIIKLTNTIDDLTKTNANNDDILPAADMESFSKKKSK